MNKEEEKKNTKKQYKVGITENGIRELNRFLDLANKVSIRKIRIPDALEIAVSKLKEPDIKKIQNLVYTASDKLQIAWDEYNKLNPNKQLTKDEFLAELLEGRKATPKAKCNDAKELEQE
ncbi:MAG: hypothetical protein ABL927_04180 [Bdellovibrionales bacterium]